MNDRPTLTRFRGTNEEPLAARSRYDGTMMSVVRFCLDCPSTDRIAISLPSFALLLSRQGVVALSAPGGDSAKHIIVAENNVTLLRPTTQVQGLFTTGHHVLDFIYWKGGTVPAFDRYLNAWIEGTPDSLHITSIPSSQVLPDLPKLVDDACARPFPRADFDLLSVILATVPVLTTTPSRIAIAPQPANLPETVVGLVAQVRSEPAKSWSLTEASTVAGYSSFHFSRMFKQLVGCGFHEFVDRCRTEVALELLTKNNRSLGSVAAEAGFPSLRAMRESIRDYLGLTVGELRGLTDRAS